MVMTSRDLFNELSNIDEELVEEAGRVVKKEVKPMKKNYGKIFGIAAAACVFIVAGSIVSIGLANHRFKESGKIAAESGDDYIYRHDMSTEQATWFLYTKDMIYFEGNTYYLMDGHLGKGVPVGEAGQNPEYDTSDYAGYPVYLVEGCKGTYKLVLEKNGEEYLFRLHEWGAEPTMSEYARVYGVMSASDIVSVKLQWGYDINKGYTGRSIITDSESLKTFYDIFFKLELDSKGYDAIVDKMAADDLKAWKEAGGQVVGNEYETKNYTPAYSGTKAFDNNVNILITTADNETIVFDYFPKIGYVNRFKATDELIDWIDMQKSAKTVACR